MVRIPVESSAVKSIGYDANSRTLQIEYTDGGVYDYFDVPPEVHAAVFTADSIGTYVNQVVKNKYRYLKVVPNR